MSFNIGRVRKPDEPYDAAWNPECGEPGQSWAGDYKNFISMDDEKGPRCPESAGCQDVRRETSDKHPDCVEIDGDDGETDDSDDEYIYESEQDESDSSYTEGEEELDEENEKSDCMPTYGWKKHSSASQGRNVRSCRLKGKDNQNTAYSSVTRDELRAMIDFVKIAQPCKPTAEAATQSASPKSNEDSELDEEFYKLGRDNGELEHLAGPDCGPLYGYSGCRITSEEMKGCTTVQWLVYKTPEWDVEFDDQIFELRSQYFLTGLSGRMPSSDDDGSEFVPVRHGADTLYPDTVSFGDVSHTWARPSLFNLRENIAADIEFIFAASS